MKSTVLKYSIASFSFLVLCCIALLLIQPVYKIVTEKLYAVQQRVLSQVRDVFGLELQYAGMSPSILSSLYIRNLHIIDSDTGSELLIINKVNFRYDILRIISGDFESAFRGLTLEGGTVAYDEVKNSRVREKITAFAADHPGSGGEPFVLDFPFDINLKNIEVSYSDKNIDCRMQLKKARIQLEKGNITADINGSASVDTQLLPGAGPFVLSFGVNGTVDSSFSRALARVRLNSIESSHFSISRLSFLFSYADSAMSLNMIQNILPFQLSVFWDMVHNDLKVKFDTEGFDPFKLITIKEKNSVLDNLKGSSLSGSYSLSVNTDGGSLKYNADGTAVLSKKFVPGGLSAGFVLSGNDSFLDVKKLKLQSSWLDVSYEGSFNFKTLIPEGYIDLRKLILPNSGSLQADIYLDPLERGFMCFIPQLFLDEQVFTAVQLTVTPLDSSIDFRFEASDYSHPETGVPGMITVEGSVLRGKSVFIQSSVSFESMFLDSIFRTVLFFTSDSAGSSVKPSVDMLAPYAISSDLYVSTDFSSLSVNIPRMVAVNTRKEREYMLLSITGNENGGDFVIEDMLWMGQSLKGNFHVDIASGFKDFFFTSDLLFNSFPYTFNGTFVPGSYIRVAGDYGLDVSVNLQNKNGLNGTLFMSGFPVPLGKYVPAISIDSEFMVNSADDWHVILTRFELEDLSDSISFEPRAALSGKLDKYGLFFDTITYTDKSSSLIGEGGVSWNYHDGIPDSVNGTLNISSPLSGEAYSATVNLSNPERIPLSSLGFLKKIYISMEAGINRFPFARFMRGQKDTDVISGSISCLGTLDSLYIAANVDKGMLSIKTFPLNFSGQAILEDKQVTVNNISADYKNQYIKDFNGSFSLENFTGEILANYAGTFGDVHLASPLHVSILPEFSYSAAVPSVITEQMALSAIPAAYNIRIDIDSLSGTGFKPFNLISLQMRRTPGRIDFSGGSMTNAGVLERAVFGYYLDTGDLSVELRDPLPVRLKADGLIVGTAMDVRVSDVYIDLSKFEKILNYPSIAVYGGIITGNLTLSGLVTDPEFGGLLTGRDVVIGVPDYVTEKIGPNTVTVQARKNGIFIDPVVMKTQKGSILFDLALTFDRWMFEKLTMNIKAVSGTLVSAKASVPVVNIEGQASPNLHIEVTSDSVLLTGNIFVQNGSAVIPLQDSLADAAVNSSLDVYINLTVTIGQHVELYFPSKDFPIIRGLITPQTPLTVIYNSVDNEYQFRGNLALRGGEIIYVRRSFYLREGRVDLNITPNSFDPIITLRAEIREQDKDGNPVRITLAADNQPLSLFSPKLTSDPPKSQEEIMILLGQIAVADTTSFGSALVSISDVFAQSVLFRRFENAVRDFLKVDIFSLRTLFIQNVIMGVTELNSGGKPLSPGNFLDNSTVYIGKYFGPSIYADAMLHFSYDESMDAAQYPGGLVFQPEIGLEMMTPFFTLRWNLSPEFTAENMKRLFIPDSSISLSWKFSF